MSTKGNLDTAQQRFAEIYRREYSAVLSFIKRRAQSSRVEDIVHETFITAWQRYADMPSNDAEIRPWLFGVARNHLLRDHRASSKREALAVKLAQHVDHVSPGHAEQISDAIDLANAWNQLTAKQQEVIALAGFESLTSQQAGQVLGITATAYRLRLHKARAALRSALTHQGG